jgi:hypothetical protein
LLLAEIGEALLQTVAHLFVRRARQTNPARFANALEPHGDVNPVAHEIAVALLDHVAEMNADAKLDALVGADPGVAIDHRALNLDREGRSRGVGFRQGECFRSGRLCHP